MTYVGAFILLFLGTARLINLVEQQTFSVLGFMLAAQSLLAGMLLLARRESSMQAPWWVVILAWTSAALPMAMYAPASTVIRGLYAVPGLVLILWSLTSMGKAFGIAPAHRGLIMSGPYRYIRHPMYAGELLSLAGTLIAFPGLRNILVLVIFSASLLWRIFQEENLLGRNEYRFYAALVKWRLVPGVW